MPQLTIPQVTQASPIVSECHECEQPIAIMHLFELDGHMYCSDCMIDKGYERCSRCNTWVDRYNSYTTAGEDTICEECYSAHYFRCDACDEIYHNDDGVCTSSENLICNGCYCSNYFTCDDCNEVFHLDDGYSTDDGIYCEYCHNERDRECICCGVSGADIDLGHDQWVCSSCKPDTTINGYSYKPQPIFFGEGKFHLGIELEIYCQNIVKSLNVLNSDDLERLYCKEDASVPHGFELVSHPMTIEEHRGFDWQELCKELVASGASGNRYNHGIHIHMSKRYLSDLHRLKLSWFLCHHINDLVKLTRRETCYHESRSVSNIIQTIKRNQEYEGSRNEILNWGSSNTVEFRLPLSTLRGETLMAILEFMDAARKFIMTDVNFITLQDCWEDFMKFCMAEGYKCLVGYYMFFVGDGYEEV